MPPAPGPANWPEVGPSENVLAGISANAVSSAAFSDVAKTAMLTVDNSAKGILLLFLGVVIAFTPIVVKNSRPFFHPRGNQCHAALVAPILASLRYRKVTAYGFALFIRPFTLSTVPTLKVVNAEIV